VVAKGLDKRATTESREGEPETTSFESDGKRSSVNIGAAVQMEGKATPVICYTPCPL